MLKSFKIGKGRPPICIYTYVHYCIRTNVRALPDGEDHHGVEGQGTELGSLQFLLFGHDDDDNE